MIKVIREDAINECFRIVQSPVYVVSRHGGYKRCLSRSAAINNLAHYMVTKVFHRMGIATNHPIYDESGRPIAHSIGQHTQQYSFAHNRTAKRVRLILAKKRKFEAWLVKHEDLKQQYFKHLTDKPY